MACRDAFDVAMPELYRSFTVDASGDGHTTPFLIRKLASDEDKTRLIKELAAICGVKASYVNPSLRLIGASTPNLVRLDTDVPYEFLGPVLARGFPELLFLGCTGSAKHVSSIVGEGNHYGLDLARALPKLKHVRLVGDTSSTLLQALDAIRGIEVVDVAAEDDSFANSLAGFGACTNLVRKLDTVLTRDGRVLTNLAKIDSVQIRKLVVPYDFWVMPHFDRIRKMSVIELQWDCGGLNTLLKTLDALGPGLKKVTISRG